MQSRNRLKLLAYALLAPFPVVSQKIQLLWRIGDIAVEVIRNDDLLGIGQYLRLRQSLRPREDGWTEMKIDLPDTWQVLRASAEGDAIAIVIEGGLTFKLTRENVGELTFRILDGAKRLADAQLEQIWLQVALSQPRR